MERRIRRSDADSALAALHRVGSPMSIAELISETGAPLGVSMRVLIVLEHRGLVEPTPGYRYRLSPECQALGPVQPGREWVDVPWASVIGAAPDPARPLGRVTRGFVEFAVSALPFLIRMHYREQLLGALGELAPADRWREAASTVPLRWDVFDRRRCRFGGHVLVIHRGDDGGYLQCTRCGTVQNSLFFVS